MVYNMIDNESLYLTFQFKILSVSCSRTVIEEYFSLDDCSNIIHKTWKEPMFNVGQNYFFVLVINLDYSVL